MRSHICPPNAAAIYANQSLVSLANCRFEHPGANNNANANPFSTLSGGGNSRGGFSKPAAAASATPFSLNKDTIQKDLAEERPSWLLSAYGPGRDAPEQLWGGYPIEQSFEEIRLHYITGEASGNPQGAVCACTGAHVDERGHRLTLLAR